MPTQYMVTPHHKTAQNFKKTSTDGTSCREIIKNY